MLRFLKSGSSISLLLFIAASFFFIYSKIENHSIPFAWELRYFLLGEKLNQGFRLYQDILENIAPASAAIYSLLHLFSIPLKLTPLIAIGIIGIQGIIFQLTIQKFDLLPKLGYLPFMIYVSMFFISMELWSLSPALMGLTFLILAWNEIVYQQRGLQANDRVFLIGLHLGLASLFFFSYAFFLWWGLYALIAYTGVNFRQIILFLVGFIFPYLISISYLNYTENLGSLFQVFQASAFHFNVIKSKDLYHIFISYLPGLTIAIMGFYILLSTNKIRTNAKKAQQSNFAWIVLSIILLFTLPNYSRYNLVFFIPGFCLIGFHIFFLFKKPWAQELNIWITISLLFISQQIEFKQDKSEFLKLGKLPFKNEKLLILGPQIEEYLNNKMSGPFINWELSKSLFENINDYEKVITLTELFEKNPPTYIFDPEKTFKRIQTKIPNIGLKYREFGNNIFKRVD